MSANDDDQEDDEKMVPGSTEDDYQPAEGGTDEQEAGAQAASPSPTSALSQTVTPKPSAPSPTLKAPNSDPNDIISQPAPAVNNEDLQKPEKLTPPVEPQLDNPDDPNTDLEANYRTAIGYAKKLDAYDAALQKQQAAETFRQQKRANNQAALADAKETGRQYQYDEQGILRPKTDPVTGQQAVVERVHPVQYDANGKPYQVTYNEGGQAPATVTSPNGTTSQILSKKIANPDAGAKIGTNPDDPTDSNLYRQNKYSQWEAINPNEGIISNDNATAIASAKHLHANELKDTKNQCADLALQNRKIAAQFPGSADPSEDASSDAPAETTASGIPTTIPSGGFSPKTVLKLQQSIEANKQGDPEPGNVKGMFGAVNQEATAKAKADWQAAEDQRKQTYAQAQGLLAADQQIKANKAKILELDTQHQKLVEEGPGGYLLRKRQEGANAIANLSPEDAQDVAIASRDQIDQADADIKSAGNDISKRIAGLQAKRQAGGNASDFAEWDKEAATIQNDSQALQQKIDSRNLQAKQLQTGLTALQKNQQSQQDAQRALMRQDPVMAPLANQLDSLDQGHKDRQAKLDSNTFLDPETKSLAQDYLDTDIQQKREAARAQAQQAQVAQVQKQSQADQDLDKQARQRMALQAQIDDAKNAQSMASMRGMGMVGPADPIIAKNQAEIAKMDSASNAADVQKRQSELQDDDSRLKFSGNEGYTVLHNGMVAINPKSLLPDGVRPKGMDSWEDQIQAAKKAGSLTDAQADILTKHLSGQAQTTQAEILSNAVQSNAFQSYLQKKNPDLYSQLQGGSSTPEVYDAAKDFLKTNPEALDQAVDAVRKAWQGIQSGTGLPALFQLAGDATGSDFLQGMGSAVKDEERANDPRLANSKIGGTAGMVGNVAGFALGGEFLKTAMVGMGVPKTIAPLLSLGAVNSVYAGQSAEDTYNRAIASGADKATAGAAAVLSGTVSMAMLLPVSHYLNGFATPIKNVLIQGLAKTAIEAGSFMALNTGTTLANNAIAQQFIDKNQSLFENVGDQALEGGFGGAILGAVSSVVGHVRLNALKQKYNLPPTWDGKAEDLMMADQQIKGIGGLPGKKQIESEIVKLFGKIKEAGVPEKIASLQAMLRVDPANIPAESRSDLASALLKISQGSKIADLNETEQAVLNKAKTTSGVGFIDEHNGSPIITDTAKAWLQATAPHAAEMIGHTGQTAKDAIDAKINSITADENTPPSQQPGTTTDSTGQDLPPSGDNSQTPKPPFGDAKPSKIESDSGSEEPSPLGDNAPMPQRKERAKTMWDGAQVGDIYHDPIGDYKIEIKANRDGSRYAEVTGDGGVFIDTIQFDKYPEKALMGNGLVFGQVMTRIRRGKSTKGSDGDAQPPAAPVGKGNQPTPSGDQGGGGASAEIPKGPLTPQTKRGKMISKILQAQGVEANVADHYAGLKEGSYPDNITNDDLRQRVSGDFQKDGGVFPKHLQQENEDPEYWKANFPTEPAENHQKYADQAKANNGKRQSEAKTQNQKILDLRPEGESTTKPPSSPEAQQGTPKVKESVPTMPEVRPLTEAEAKQAKALSARLQKEAGASPSAADAFARQHIRGGGKPADVVRAFNDAGGIANQDQIRDSIGAAESLQGKSVEDLVKKASDAYEKEKGRPLTDKERDTLQKAIENLAPALARWNKAFSRIDITGEEAISAGVSYIPYHDALEINIGDLLYPGAVDDLLQHPDRPEMLMRHEAIHSFITKALGDMAREEGKGREHWDIASDIYKGLPDALKEAVRHSYVGGAKDQLSPQEGGHEFLRMVIEGDLAINNNGVTQGGVTLSEETLPKPILAKVRNSIRRVLNYLSDLSRNLAMDGVDQKIISQIEDAKTRALDALRSTQKGIDEDRVREYQAEYDIRRRILQHDGRGEGGLHGEAQPQNGGSNSQGSRKAQGEKQGQGLPDKDHELPPVAGGTPEAGAGQAPELNTELEKLRAEKAKLEAELEERKAADERKQERLNKATQIKAGNTADKAKIVAKAPEEVRPQVEKILSQMHMGDPTYVLGSNRERLPAAYFAAPLELVQASHQGSDFQINPSYGGENTRPYHTDETEQNKVRQMALPGALDEDSIVSDVKSSADGPPQYALTIFNDKDGNPQVSLQSAGGNGRLQGIKLSEAGDQSRLADLWKAREGHFGLQGMPDGWMGGRFLGVYDLRNPDQAKAYQQLVDKLNPSQGVVQDTATRADIDAALKIPVERLAGLPITMSPDQAKAELIGLIKESDKLGLDRNLMSGLVKNPSQAQFYMQRLMLAAAFHSKPLSEFFSSSQMSNGHATAVGLIKASAEAALRLREAKRPDIADAFGRTLENIADYVNRGDKIGSAIRKAAEQTEMGKNGAVMNLIASALEKKVAYFEQDKKGIKRVDSEETISGFTHLMSDIASSVERFSNEGGESVPDLLGNTETAESTIERAISAHQAKIERGNEGNGSPSLQARRAQDPVKRMHQLMRKRSEEGLNQFETQELTDLEKKQGQHFMSFFDEARNAPFLLESEQEQTPSAPSSPADQLSLLSRRTDDSESNKAAEELKGALLSRRSASKDDAQQDLFSHQPELFDGAKAEIAKYSEALEKEGITDPDVKAEAAMRDLDIPANEAMDLFASAKSDDQNSETKPSLEQENQRRVEAIPNQAIGQLAIESGLRPLTATKESILASVDPERLSKALDSIGAPGDKNDAISTKDEEPTTNPSQIGSKLVDEPSKSDLFGNQPSGREITDFGEKIAGARKDAWRQLSDSMSQDLPEKAADITLSKNFPEPDYGKLLKEGWDPGRLAAIKAVRDTIPRKPTHPYKLARWAEVARKVHSALNSLINPEGDRDSLRAEQNQAFMRSDLIGNRVKLYEALGFPACLDAKEWTVEQSHGVTMWDGKEIPRGTPFTYAEYKGRWMPQFSLNPNKAEAIKEVAEQIRPKIEEAQRAKGGEGQTRNPKKIAFNIYRDRSSGELFIGKKGLTSVLRIKAGFPSLKDARDYLQNRYDELANTWEGMKTQTTGRNETNAPREGKSQRAGDVSPNQFREAFGFRGVQFGNYVENARRQTDLNHAFDALMDLSDALGIPAKALSLDGQLGLAFGARGRGGKNAPAAHYEPDEVAINLTKHGGPGALAHEWFHGLDNYFSRFNSTGKTDFGLHQEYATNQSRSAASVRPEVWEAFNAVKKALENAGFSERSKALDETRSKPYWNTTIEKAARAFEQYVKDRLEERGISNDYLANIEKGHPGYPKSEEMEQGEIRQAFDRLFNTLDTKESDRGTALYSRRSADISEKNLENYLTERGLDRTKIKEASNEITRQLQEIGRLGEKGQDYGDLFSWKGGAGDEARPDADKGLPQAEAPQGEAVDASHPLLKLTKPGAAEGVFGENKNRVSSLIHSLINREIPYFNIEGSIIKGPEDFAAALMPLRSPYMESLKVAFLDKENRVIHSQVLFVGTLNESVAHPRDFAIALESAKQKNPNVASVLIAHNHPSGDPTPSDADRRITPIIRQTLEAIGIKQFDHIITNGQTGYSFDRRSEFLIPENKKAPWEALRREELTPLDETTMPAYVANLRQGSQENAAHIIYLNTKNRVTAVERVPDGAVDEHAVAKAISAGIGRESPFGVVVDLAGKDRKETYAVVRRIQEVCLHANVPLMDASSKDIASFRSVGILEAPSEYGNSLAKESSDQLQLDFNQARKDGEKTPAQRLAENKDLIDRTAGLFSGMPNYDADEARQKARIAVANAARNFDASKGVPFEAYAKVVAKNALKDLYKAESRHADHFQTTLDSPLGTDSQGNEVTHKDQLADKATPLTPDAAARNESQRILNDSIATLPERMQQAVKGMIEGKSGQEIADEIGVSRQAVHNLQEAAMRRLRGKLGEQGISDPDQLLSRRTAPPEGSSPDDHLGDVDSLMNHLNQARDEEGGDQPYKVGTPERAYGASLGPEGRAVDQAYQDKLDASREDENNPRTQAAWVEGGKGLVENDEAGTAASIQKKGISGDVLTPEETMAARIISNRLQTEAAKGDADAFQKFADFWTSYRQTGSNASDAMNARKDLYMSPADRHRAFLMDAITKPSRKLQDLIKKGGDPSKIKEMLSEETKAVFEKLKQAGISPQDILQDKVSLRLVDRKAIDSFRSLLSRATSSISDLRRQAFDMILKNKSWDAIAKQTGIKAEEIQKIKDAFIAKMRADHFDKFKAGAKADSDSLLTGEKVPLEQANREFEKWLRKLGIVPDGEQGRPKFNISDPAHVMRMRNAISKAKGESSIADKLYEVWVNGLLSGPQTHVAIAASNSAAVAWDATIQRGMEALINLAMRDPNAASFGEFKQMLKGIMPSIGRSYSIAARGWAAEHDFYQSTVLGTPDELNKDNEFSRPGHISGWIGRLIRTPGRAVLFADHMFTTTYGHVHVGAEAYRIAKAEGLKGQAFTDRVQQLSQTRGDVIAKYSKSNPPSPEMARFFAKQIAALREGVDPEDLIADRDSDAWTAAREQAAYDAAKKDGWTDKAWQKAFLYSKEVTFKQELQSRKEGGNHVEDIAFKLQKARSENMLLSTIFPFVRTPYNIFRIGIRKSPLGAGNLLAMATKGLYGMKDGKPYLEGHPTAVRDLAEQALAWGGMALLWGACQGDKDDDDKKLLITGSPDQLEEKDGKGTRELNERAYGGGYVVRIGGRHGIYIPYGRLEPFATVMGVTADIIRGIKRNGSTADNLASVWNFLVGQVKDKSFLQGINSISSLLEGKNNPSGAVKRTIMQAFVPNLIRSPLRSLDDYVRDNKTASPLYDALPAPSNAQPKIDVYGEPVKKSGNPLVRLFVSTPLEASPELHSADRLLLNWNHSNPSEAWAPQSPKAFFKGKDGKDVEMTGEETTKYHLAAGRLAVAKLRGIVNPRNIANPRREDVKAVKEAFEQASHEAKERIFNPGYLSRRNVSLSGS